MTRTVRSLALLGLGALLGLLLFAFRPVAHALPEYATRTGEPCATCHVNPAGGGPRTVRGTLWIAAGRPDKVPPLPDSQPAATAAPEDGAALYAQLGCSGCHGAAGEGAAGPALNKRELPASELSQLIRSGRGAMSGVQPEALTDDGLAALVQYVGTIGRGAVKAAPEDAAGAMSSPRQSCSGAGDAQPATGSCGGN